MYELYYTLSNTIELKMCKTLLKYYEVKLEFIALT